MQIFVEPEGVLEPHPALHHRLKAITLNNLGVYHKYRGDPRAALPHLQAAAELEREIVKGCEGGAGLQQAMAEGRVENPAGTLLNLSAVLSSLGDHQEALRHAREACVLLCEMCGVRRGELEKWCVAAGPGRPFSASSSRRVTGGSSFRSSRGSISEGGPGDAAATQSDQQQQSSGNEGGEGQSGAPAEIARVDVALRSMEASQSSVLSMALYNEAVELEHMVGGCGGWWLGGLGPWGVVCTLLCFGGCFLQ